MPIHLTKIYTKSGDDGRTSLPGGSRVAKDDSLCETPLKKVAG